MTLTVGFRLGNDILTRQVTVLVTESGVLHRAQGLYGKLPRVSPPVPSVALTTSLPDFRGENPLARPIADLRQQHASYTRKGYQRILIPPSVVRVDVREYPPRPVVRHRELIHAFVAAATATPVTPGPSTPSPSLEAAITAFRSALGLPSRPERVAGATVPRPRGIPPRVAAMLRTLAHGSPLTPSRRLPVGWTVTGQGVRLRVGAMGEVLDRADVIELHAALNAWLLFTRDGGPPVLEGGERSGRSRQGPSRSGSA
ncbi:hypothetical protein GCM10017562_73360 [Streptomyces roseofulvus]|uniref:Uncharacterized protein n=2 Tax=Streptomyces TaxID=1883 RepID=A0ABU4KFT1_9ACTN|nr:hypothetical protein [Streptomyces roseolus]MDX2296649.1 hypothetical protein [Streptomyces roseolus]